MRTLTSFAILASSLAACGDKGSNQPDAEIIVPDAPPPDSPPPPPPPDAPSFDFSCMNNPLPTTAADPITAAGTTQEITMNGPVAKANVLVDTFKSGVATRVNRVTSDNAGAFTTGNIVTGGVPFDGFIQGTATTDGTTVDATYRRTFVFPPTPLDASAPNVPVLLVAQALVDQLAIAIGQQNDATNGMLFVAITDCANTPISGATLSVKQNNTEVGTQFDLSTLSAQAAGLFFVGNVPDGDAVVSASFNGMALRAHTVKAFKKTGNEAGSITTTIVRPGP